MQPHVVIVGAGFGGLLAARNLKNAPVRVTIVDRSNHHLFQPLLYQVATAGLSPADIAVPIRAVLSSSRNTEVMMAEVTGVDPSARKVRTSHGELAYDYLVLATGARHSYFGKDEWEKFAPGLKAIHDATTIRKRILLAFEQAEMETDPRRREEFLTFVVVGGGPTGVEMAGSIAELSHFALRRDFRRIDPAKAKILLLEAGPRVLAAFPDTLSDAARGKLERLGVEVRTGGRVEAIDEHGVVVSGERVAASTVIWAAGVVASPAARWLGTAMDRVGRAMVGPELTVAGHPEIFVIGDTAHVEENGKLLPGVAPVAMQQGRYVASAIRARLQGKSVGPFHYVDKGNLATVGRTFAVADLGWTRLRGTFAWLVWVVVHIYYLIGFRSRLIVLLEWAWAYLTFGRGARLIVD